MAVAQLVGAKPFSGSYNPRDLRLASKRFSYFCVVSAFIQKACFAQKGFGEGPNILKGLKRKSRFHSSPGVEPWRGTCPPWLKMKTDLCLALSAKRPCYKSPSSSHMELPREDKQWRRIALQMIVLKMHCWFRSKNRHQSCVVLGFVFGTAQGARRTETRAVMWEWRLKLKHAQGRRSGWFLPGISKSGEAKQRVCVHIQQ